MPYKLRKAPKRDLYWVVAQDGKHMSKDPLPKERAQAQMRALYANEGKMKGSGETYTREGKRIEAKLMRHGIGSLTQKEKAYLADEMIRKHPVEYTPAEIAAQRAASAAASGTRPAVNVLPEVRHPVGTEVSAADRLQTHRPGSRHARAKGYGRRRLRGGDDMFGDDAPAPMTNAQNIANLRSQGINVNADGSVDQASLAKHVTDNINATQQGIAAEQAAQAAAGDKQAWKDTWNIGGDVVGSVGDVLGMIPGIGEYLKPVAGVAGDILHAIGSGKRCIRGGGPMPPRNILQQIASAAYMEGRGSTPPAFIGHWQRVGNSPTLVFYRNSDSIVVGIRGTMGSLFGEDWRANYTLPFNGLAGTNRYKKDRDALLKFQSRYPPSQFEYYGVGHSLGGAILDMFLSEGLIKNGVSYNPAIQTKDIKGKLPNERIYDANDPLYAMMGSQASEKPEVRAPAQPTSAAQSALGYLHPAIAVANAGQSYLNAHNLTNFQGGKKKRLTKVSLFS